MKVRNRLPVYFCGIGVSFALGGASVAQTTDSDFPHLLRERYPATAGAKVERAFPGFWSVSKDAEVFFIRDDLSVLIRGDVIDLRSNQSIVTRIQDANRPKISPAEFDTRDAIVFGNGSRRLFVFSDPDCPYCRRLEGELAKLHDVELFVFPFPIAGLHPNAQSVAETVWCQKDRAAAWRQYLTTGQSPAAAHCENPIGRNVALAQRLQILGTPALVFEDGTVVPGAVSSERVEAQLAASARR